MDNNHGDGSLQVHPQVGWFVALAGGVLLLVAFGLVQHLPHRPHGQPLIYPVPQYPVQHPAPQPVPAGQPAQPQNQLQPQFPQQ